ncbi:MFS general substrate transporter [Aspergillus vadensis CBS 113365]|uniref:MFS general substrate transporter n=1 Tax=Aspergillus vadensis (strain CBS 113365 / IMI 142717 / IBT 24658) TaxID=1448311 RepID=A0A319BRJ5_ASPVC|nr:MFS general substrate transporter [Aspergillus vadensis CBS 113365]PYH65808.1 MFS general substrate transporter [Aspergillus vadensis CBS 113365]
MVEKHEAPGAIRDIEAFHLATSAPACSWLDDSVRLGLLAAIAGFAFPAPLLAIINQDIGPSADISWVSLTYTLTIAVGLTLIGRITDIFGRRYIFIGGGVLGTVGSIVCARADSVNTLIGGMTLIGLAASTQVSYFYVVAELVPMKYRFAANSLMYVFTTPGGAFAPAIGESLVRTTFVGWRGVF